MTDAEKIAKLEEIWGLDEGTLKEETALENVEAFDSMGKLYLVVLCDEEFSKKLDGDTVRGFKTVKDILDFMG